MSEPTGEKTEQASPRKLEESFNKGQFARSAEVQTIFVMMAGLFALMFTGRDTFRQMFNSFAVLLSHLHSVPLSESVMQGYAISAVLVFAQCVGPLVIATLLGGLLAGAIQNRFRTAPEAMAPNWGRLNPMQGFKRIFSMRSATPTALAMLKMGVVIALSYSVIKDVLSDPIFFNSVSAARIAEFMADSSFKIILRIGFALIFIAVVDYSYQLWQTSQDLMMTRQEVKEEMKNSEGNPQMKARRRRRAGMTLRRMLSEVPLADVIVTNPTHLAVALRYDRKTMRAPRVVAKGARLNAMRIREIAAQHQIPVIENKPLARMMFKHCRVGGEVPAKLFAAVAEVLAWVYRVNRYRYYVEQNKV